MKTWLGGLGLLVLLGACATEKKEVPPSPMEVTEQGFVLEQAPMKPYAEPLPDKQDVFVTWHYTDGSTKRVLAYRGWDFNKDGRVDMLEVMALDGTSEAMAFDFNGDGKIDMLKKREKNEFDISQAVNMPQAPKPAVQEHTPTMIAH